uniref:ANK_REP_REGION domain-containing protein n=1 Tax=Caenorhabditis japonica TaxID=281687 RepID=A0A8R1ILL4_CAEJA
MELSLVIRERVLGGSHSDVHYYLRFRGAVYCDMGQLNKCYDLWKHALELQQTHFAPLHLGTVTTFQSFQETFVMTINDFINQHHQLPGLRVKSSWVKYLFDRICLELERVVKYQGNLLEDTECCGREPCIHATEDGEIQKLVIVAVHLVNIIDRLSLPSMENSAEKDEDLAEKDVKLDVERLLRSCHLKRIPFLHYALEERLHDPESLPKAAVLAQFLECPDVDVNSKDKNGNTPLHIVLQARVPRGSLISLLLRHGAYLLARNDDGVVVWNELKRMHQGVDQERVCTR